MHCSSQCGEYRYSKETSDHLSSSFLSIYVSAGFIVKQMGLPLKLVAMVSSNDIVHRTVTTGDFSMATNVTQTLASAIDIQVLHLLKQYSSMTGLTPDFC